ncbi:MAG: alpha/beta fold hydrolase [Rhizobiales bacterium]|nr:alpha/beta fold hydrolase [Hyphomicrobiales bacterium]
MPQPAQQIRFCTSRDGTRIAYATCGSGPPLVWMQHWVHHLNLDWDSPVWRDWLTFLARRNMLVRYDHRGCGLSDRDGITFSFEKLHEDFEAVMTAVDAEPSVVFAMGGAACAVAMSYAIRHTGRVSRLILYAPYMRNRLAGEASAAQVEEANTRLKVIELGWPNDNPAYGQFFTSLHMPDASEEQFRSYNELLRRATKPTNAIGLLKAMYLTDARELVPKVRCPTLVLHARGDSVIPFDEGRAVAALIPGAQFVPLESRNHVLLPDETAWQRLVEAIDAFVPGPGRAVHAPAQTLDALTPRENEVLELVAQGHDNDTIAGRLGISAKTVRNQVSIIFSKLEVNSRAQAIVRARDAGFGRKAHI